MNRSHLVNKIITNKAGHRQTVWVRPDDLVLHHGSTKRFNYFKADKILSGTGMGVLGKGFYFDDVAEFVKSYAGYDGYDYTCTLNKGLKFLDLNKKNNIEFYKKADEITNGAILLDEEDQGNTKKVIVELENYYNEGLIGNTKDSKGKVQKAIEKMGYKGIVAKDQEGGGNTYVVYDPDAITIKSVDKITKGYNELLNKLNSTGLNPTEFNEYIKQRKNKKDAPRVN